MNEDEQGKNNKVLLIIIICVILAISGFLIYFNSDPSPKTVSFNVGLNLPGAETEREREGEGIIKDIGFDILSHPKIDALRETPAVEIDYEIGNKNPFEPFE